MSRLSWLVLVFCVLILPVPASARKADPPTERSPYELRTVRVGNTFQCIRFKPASGESWILAEQKWQPMEESGPIPAGDYDITLVATDEAFTALRFDRKTGTAWLLRGRKWVRVQEPKET
jgi:hypothetical protein